MKRTTVYGSWASPLSAARISATGVRFSQPRIVNGCVYWLEGRPAELGRSVLVRARPDETPRDLTPAPFSVRSRVHEYGGGAYAASDEAIYFVHYEDQQIYRQAVNGGRPQALTNAPGCRFADLIADKKHRRLICVREDHRAEGQTPVNTLVSVTLHDGRVSTLAEGHDFFSSPALRPDGGQLAWLCWDAPLMPWQGCELWLADLDKNGTLHRPRRIAGGTQESIFQPQFAPDGVLHFISDRSGYWNIYKATSDPSKSRHPRTNGNPEMSGNGMPASAGMTNRQGFSSGVAASVTAVTRGQMDHGFAQWNFGMSSYGFLDDGTVLAARIHDGASELVSVRPDGKTEMVDTGMSQIEHLHAAGRHCAALAASPTRSSCVFFGPPGHLAPVSPADDLVPATCISEPQFIHYPTTDGESAYAWYYPPRNPDYLAAPDELPPLLVKCHGGPTAMNGNGLDARIRFWTSRGFAVADVNYRGSSGFGRCYRQSLHGTWGLKDAEDCVEAARYLVTRGLADPRRLAISGGSAGGFTVLCALAFHKYFRAGAVYYGLSELESAMRDTHKFEAHYGDSLLGPWPQARETYRARSPLYAADRIDCPVIFFQGLKDKVVPPDQTERMVQALRTNKVPVEYLSFPEEGHGFRRRDTLQQALAAELAFYGQVFGFTPALEA